MVSPVHAIEAERLADEFADLLGPAAVAKLRAAFEGQTRTFGEELLRELVWDSQAMMILAPDRRLPGARRLAPSENDRLLLLWATVVWAHRAARVLRALEGRSLVSRDAPSETTSTAAYAAHEASDPETLWPFSAPSPWAEEP